MKALEKLLFGERFEPIAGIKEIVKNLLNFREASGSERLQGTPELADGGVGKRVVDVEAMFFALDQSGAFENLEMLRGGRGGFRSCLRQFFDGARCLTEQVENLQPSWMGERLSDSCVLLEQVFLNSFG
jgi:hypothetical protein